MGGPLVLNKNLGGQLQINLVSPPRLADRENPLATLSQSPEPDFAVEVATIRQRGATSTLKMDMTTANENCFICMCGRGQWQVALDERSDRILDFLRRPLPQR